MSARPTFWNPTAPISFWPRRSGFARNASASFVCQSMKGWSAWSPNRSARWRLNMPGIIRASSTSAKRVRMFPENEIRLLTEAAKRVAPVVREARTLDRFIAPAQERLWALARNLWWSWDHDSAGLFHDLDPLRWSQLNHSPVSLLNEYPLEKLEARATELALHSRINYAYRRLREYQDAERTWGARHAGVLRPRPVAYFSAEFGVHESLPVYSGGLGVLAGDHIKSASDLGIPLVGVGLFYGQGYFRQRLDRDGWQREEYLET